MATTDPPANASAATPRPSAFRGRGDRDHRHHPATTIRSRPARSRSVAIRPKPAWRAAATDGPACQGAISTTSAPDGPNHRGHRTRWPRCRPCRQPRVPPWPPPAPPSAPTPGPTGRGQDIRTRSHRVDWTPGGQPGRPARRGGPRTTSRGPAPPAPRPPDRPARAIRGWRGRRTGRRRRHRWPTLRDPGSWPGPPRPATGRWPPIRYRDPRTPGARRVPPFGRQPDHVLTTSGSPADPVQLPQGHLHQVFGLGPGDEHPWVHVQFHGAERPGAEHVLQGLARLPPIGQRLGQLGAGVVDDPRRLPPRSQLSGDGFDQAGA